MPCPHCRALEDRIIELEDLLGIQQTDTLQLALREAIIIRPGGRRQVLQFILALYNAKGRILSHNLLLFAIPPSANPYGDDERVSNITRVWASSARRALGKDAIATVWGIGYYLTPVGREKVAELLGEPTKTSTTGGASVVSPTPPPAHCAAP